MTDIPVELNVDSKKLNILEEKEDIEDVDLINYLFYICGYLMDTEFDKLDLDDIITALESLLDEVSEIKRDYELEPPEGTEGVQEIVMDILIKIENGIEEILYYTDEESIDYIEDGIKSIEIADTMIDQLRDSISQQKMELADILSKIKQGKIKEGQPIEDDVSFNLTDQEIEGNFSEDNNLINITDEESSNIEEV